MIIVHADWGSNPKKRWMCVARRGAGSRFTVGAPELVGDLETFWDRLEQRADGGGQLVGFDFPIGLPAEYARIAGISDFRSALEAFGRGDWADFYDLARHKDQVCVRRPFYPYKPGGTRHAHLLEGLGLPDMSRLLRTCERPTPARSGASPLFWTLGGKQVGRAAIIGWRDIIVPALRKRPDRLKLWPFDGDLTDLVSADAAVVVETYPAQACVHLGFTAPGTTWSKTSQEGRLKAGAHLLEWVGRRDVSLSDSLKNMLRAGFGPSSSGEDPFDAVVGLLSMLKVTLDGMRAPVPDDDTIRNIEGWIIGQGLPVA